MSFFSIQDFLILDKGSQALKRQFENHCEWCWGGMGTVIVMYAGKPLGESTDQLELKN